MLGDWLSFATVTLRIETVFCFSVGLHRMKGFPGNRPLASHTRWVNRHSAAWRIFREKAPGVTHSIKPRSCSSQGK